MIEYYIESRGVKVEYHSGRRDYGEETLKDLGLPLTLVDVRG